MAAIGQGTWRLRDPDRSAAALREGLRLGMTHIDTAELYEQQSGSETLLGPLLAEAAPDGRPWRDHVMLASKVLPQNASAKGIPAACKDSLLRLGTDHLDLYYHHWRSAGIPLDETLRALADLVDVGWVKMIGVSNYGVDDLDEALGILGRGHIAANQVDYHLGDRQIERDVLAWCKQHSVTVVAYSPFGGGAWISGKRLRAVEEVARETHRTPRQVALAFLLRQEHVVAIPKTESVAHVRQNAATRLPLEREAVAKLEDALGPP